MPVFFVFDTETSGLHPGKDRIVEITVAKYVCDLPIADIKPFSLLVHPRRQLSKENAALHGASNEMMAGEKRFIDVWPLFHDYVEQACEIDEHPLLVAHNAKFDVDFLRAELRRNSLPVPDWQIACSCRMARSLWPGEPARLADLAAKLNVGQFAEHRAGGDVKGLCKVMDGVAEVKRCVGSMERLLLRTSYFLTEPAAFTILWTEVGQSSLLWLVRRRLPYLYGRNDVKLLMLDFICLPVMVFFMPFLLKLETPRSELDILISRCAIRDGGNSRFSVL